MHDDLIAMHDILIQRRFAADEILVLEGTFTREDLLKFLRDARRKMDSWLDGEVVFYFTGHGDLRGSTAADAEAGLWLPSADSSAFDEGEYVPWGEVLSTLAIPNEVQLTLLPDT